MGGVTTDYFLDGSRIVAQKTGNNTIWYYYDGDGTREAIEYGGNVYYYFYNAQGDVVGLSDNNLNVVVEYTYDSWGNVLSITGSLANTLGKDNPFRYRGYYFDSDTELYYLNSRYYDANVGRFINADGLLGINQDMLEYNIFAYCSNDPINCIDTTGQGKVWNWVKQQFNNIKNWMSSKVEVVKTINQEVASETITGATDVVLNNLKPGSYTKNINFTNAIPAIVKNTNTFFKNTASTAIAPIKTTLKSVNKSIGLGTIAFYGLSLYDDYNTYGSSIGDFMTAALITTMGVAAGVCVGTACASAGLPIVATMAITVGVGSVISIFETGLKKQAIGY